MFYSQRADAIYPSEVLLPASSAGLPDEPIVLSYQIRTIDKLRLTHKYSELNDPVNQEEIYESTYSQLGIDR